MLRGSACHTPASTHRKQSLKMSRKPALVGQDLTHGSPKRKPFQDNASCLNLVACDPSCDRAMNTSMESKVIDEGIFCTRIYEIAVMVFSGGPPSFSCFGCNKDWPKNAPEKTRFTLRFMSHFKPRPLTRTTSYQAYVESKIIRVCEHQQENYS